MNLETMFFDYCGVCRDRFTNEIRKARKEYDVKKKEIESRYKGDYAKQAATENKNHFEEVRLWAVERAKKELLEEFDKQIIKEKAAVSCVHIGGEYMKALDALKGVPVSREEFEIIAHGCADKSYWVAQKLRMLAKDNGILNAPELPPTYTERVKALETARDRMMEFFDSGDIEDMNVHITDKALRLLEQDFMGGYQREVKPDKQAALLIDQAKNCENMMCTAVFLKNALETSPEEVRQEIIKKVSEDSSYWQTVREYGLGSVLDKIGKEEKETEKSVLHLVKDARLAGQVAKLTEAEREAAKYGSGIYPENTGSERKIDKQGLEFLKTEEGRQTVKRFERSAKVARERVAEREAEAETRAAIMEG